MTAPLPVPKPADWMRDAACIGLAFGDVDPWHSEPHEGDLNRVARRICAECPVKQQCREYGQTLPGNYGIWGGQSKRRIGKVRGQ
jgi:WhiB family transcriptional regulator, redox-sensing transcriptional regulator